MHRYQKQLYALGSDIYMTIVTENNSTYADNLFANLIELISKFEFNFSRFKSDSELTKFNEQAGLKTSISPAFKKILTTAKKISLQTNELYNPFILPALQKAGYLGSWPNPNKLIKGTDFSNRKSSGVNSLKIGTNWASIPKNTALDLGGIGKGYLLDELADYLNSKKLSGYWLSLGGDIVCDGHDAESREWSIDVQSATDLNNLIYKIHSNGEKKAIATSGIIKRQGNNHGVKWHHIIDPRTGLSANTKILTATVIAKFSMVADVYAKCIVIAGANQAKEYLNLDIFDFCLIQTSNNTKVIEKTK